MTIFFFFFEKVFPGIKIQSLYKKTKARFQIQTYSKINDAKIGGDLNMCATNKLISIFPKSLS